MRRLRVRRGQQGADRGVNYLRHQIYGGKAETAVPWTPAETLYEVNNRHSSGALEPVCVSKSAISKTIGSETETAKTGQAPPTKHKDGCC